MKKALVFKFPFLTILFLGLLLRTIIMLLYNYPSFCPDSAGYIELAKKITTGTLLGYNGLRTPGYPLLILLMGSNYKLVVGLQILMDALSCYFIYDIIKKYNPLVALLSSLYFFTLVNVIMFSLAILTESATQFFLIFLIWLVERFQVYKLAPSYLINALAAFLLMVLFFVRPMFIYVTPILAFFMLFYLKRGNITKGYGKILLILTLPFLTYFGWNYLNYINNGWFTPTTFLGINLAQNSVSFFQYVPDEHQEIREIYIKYREKAKKTDGNEAAAIWRAHDELIEKTQLSEVELSRKLAEICKPLIKSHPKEYGIQVVKNWSLFWNAYPYYYDELIIYSNLFKIVHLVWWAQKFILWLLYAFFLPLSVLAFIRSVKDWNIFTFENLLLAIIYAASILQALVTYGENSRFSFPLFPLVLIFLSIELTKFERVKKWIDWILKSSQSIL